MKHILIGIVVLSFFASCKPSREVVYFNELQESRIRSNTQVPETIIQPNDILSITVSSLNADATKIFNIYNETPGNESSAGYLVNTDGNIQFPILGEIKAAGLSKKQLQDKLTSSLIQKELLTDPIILIRFLNYRVTVLGEVMKPTVINVPSEKISLLEAIGIAGDMTLQAKRDNVLIIREEGDQKVFKRVNLNSSEIFTSPYYYLKSNDIVYIEPSKSKIATSKPQPPWIPYVLSGLSIAIGIVTLLRF